MSSAAPLADGNTEPRVVMAVHSTRPGEPDILPTPEHGAFRAFFEEHQRGIFSLLVHLGVDNGQAVDLAQHVFARVWEEGRWLVDDERVVLCYRYALSWGRSAGRNGRCRRHPLGAMNGATSRNDAGDPADHVLAALSSLPEEERAALVLSAVAHLRLEQIARVLRQPQWRLRGVLRRAWQQMRTLLADGNEKDCKSVREEAA